jgi:predicted nucleic acid-binding protein
MRWSWRNERSALRSRKRKAFLKNLAGLDIEIEPMIIDWVFDEGISLATTYRLSVYDATYLGIAIRQNLELIRASKDVGVSLFIP